MNIIVILQSFLLISLILEDLSKLNPLDSFQQELKAVKSFITKFDTKQFSTEKSLGESIEFGSPKASPLKTHSEWSEPLGFQTEKRSRHDFDGFKTTKFKKHKLRVEGSPTQRLEKTMGGRKSVAGVLQGRKNKYLKTIEK